MIRNLKTLWLVLLTALAMSALIASAAPAEVFYFESDSEHTSLSGEQIGTDVLAVDGGEIKCENVSYGGTVSGEAAAEIQLDPTYAGCSFASFGSATVHMNSCYFVLQPVTKESSNYEVKSRIDCEEEGDSIVATASLFGTPKCTVHVPEQEGLKSITVSEAGGGDITADFGISSMKYDQTAAGTGFGACSKATGTSNGTYEGHAVVNGGEAALSLRPVLRRVKILTDPIPFKMQGEKIKFEVESNHTAAVEVKLFIRPDGTKMLAIPGGCKGKSLAKMGDKCSEEIECEAKQGKNDVVLMAISEPAGADMVDVKGC